MILDGIEIYCPRCRGDLAEDGVAERVLWCRACDARYPVVLDIPDLRVFSDPYIGIPEDVAKGKRIAQRFDDFDFKGLVDFYYSITSVVPPQHARLYTRGLLSAVERAAGALDAWRQAAGPGGLTAQGALLDLGCGTAPLLVAAPPERSLVGVDIAFRWLVVAKKRLQEAGRRAALVCACAEALPFREGAFGQIAAESTIENVRDQERAAAEAHRVLAPRGAWTLSTPNRLCPGPDPHIGTWGASLLPPRSVAALVRRQGGIPPARRLLSLGGLRRLLERSGFRPVRTTILAIREDQRRQLSPAARFLVGVYESGTRVPLAGELLRQIGPIIQAVAVKPAAAGAALR